MILIDKVGMMIFFFVGLGLGLYIFIDIIIIMDVIIVEVIVEEGLFFVLLYWRSLWGVMLF